MAADVAAKAVSTHSRPKAAGILLLLGVLIEEFQLTAARRRLVGGSGFRRYSIWVSTHSRPKAAGGARARRDAA